MDRWFEDIVEHLIWKALQDFYGWVASTLEAEVESELSTLTFNPDDKPLSSSPLVRVLDVSPTTVTFLVRGRVPIYKKAFSAFMRIEAVVGKDVDFSSGNTPIDIQDWHTIIGDIDIAKKMSSPPALPLATTTARGWARVRSNSCRPDLGSTSCSAVSTNAFS